MNNPTVSIILPNRNYAAFIPDAIASIKAQTLTDWECIIIDDASTDNSVEVIKSLIADDNRFKLIVNASPRGISTSRNLGINAATGEYISFLDSDDCYAEFFLEMLVKLAREADVEVAGALAKIVDENFHFKVSDTKWNTYDYTFFEDALDMVKAPQVRKWIWCWRKIYKRSLLKYIRFRDEMKVNGDDVMFMLDLQWHVPRIAESNIEGVYHRTHKASVTSRFDIGRVTMFPLMFKYINDGLLDKYKKDFWDAFYSGLFLLLLSECFIRFSNVLNNQDKKDLKRVLKSACKQIVKKRLPFKQRLLCRYLIWKK